MMLEFLLNLYLKYIYRQTAINRSNRDRNVFTVSACSHNNIRFH